MAGRGRGVVSRRLVVRAKEILARRQATITRRQSLAPALYTRAAPIGGLSCRGAAGFAVRPGPAAGAFAAGLALLAAAPHAQAQIAAGFTIAATGLDFGTLATASVLGGAPITGPYGTITLTCTLCLGNFTIAIGPGAHFGSNRNMQNATGAPLQYNLFSSTTNLASNIPWDTTNTVTTALFLIFGSSATISVLGEIYGSQQTAQTGVYSDIVAITVSY